MGIENKLVNYVSDDYEILKIKPDSRLTSNSYLSIIKVFHSLHKPLLERISQSNHTKYNSDVNIEVNNVTTYEIVFDGADKKNTPSFNFGVPVKHTEYIKQRIQGIFPQSTIKEDKDYASEFDNSYVFEYKYEKDSVLSIKTSENNFLQMMLNLKNDIEKDEKILFQVSMMPIGKSWQSFAEDKWDKIRKGKDITVKRGLLDKSLEIINNTANELLSVADSIMDIEKKEVTQVKDTVKTTDFSTASRNKKSDDGFMAQIKVYVVCKSKLKATGYATAIQTCMMEFEEDNRLVQCKAKTGSVTRGFSIKSIGSYLTNIMSCKEMASIVNIPNQRQQREFKIDNVNVRQIDAPKECIDSSSGIRIGNMEIYGENKPIYYPKSKDFLAMPKFALAGMGSGKSTWLLNYANDVVSSGQSLIDINFVNECELAYAIKDIHKNHIIIDLSDENNLPSLMLPEIRIFDTDTPSQRRKKAGNCATEVEYFINSITSKGTEDISTRMGQYLSCAAKIVFIYNNMKIQTVFDILDDENIREEWIEKAIESGVYTEDSYEIRKLRKLDDDTTGKLVTGVIDRYSELMKHETFQLMLDNDNSQFDFIDIMDNNKSISICMPEVEFTNKAIKDVIITYLLCRLRLAMLGRKDKDKVVHVLIDEAHHLTKSLDVISNSIAEPRKYGVAFCFCTHYFKQLGEKLQDAVMNVGGHYILLKGIGESVYEALKSKIGDDWAYEDIKAMDDYNSFNMIWIRSQHYMFVTKMLSPLTDSRGKKYIGG